MSSFCSKLILCFCHRSAVIPDSIFSRLCRENRISFSTDFPTNNTRSFSVSQKFQLPATKMVDSSETLSLERDQFLQNVFVMRHGDRIDNFEPLWISNAQRPWDPPLTETGKIRAWCTGKRLREEGFQIHRVFISPFLRCIQTAAEVVSALCVDKQHLVDATSENAVIDPSKVKVSIEFGLCEVLNSKAIRIEMPPTDGNWVLDISQLEAMLPAGTTDHSPECVYQKLPEWEETWTDAGDRYEKVIRTLANKFPRENLLLVTHGEGVSISVSAFMKHTTVSDIDYCAYTHLQRSVSCSSTEQGFPDEEFKLLTTSGEAGINYSKDVLPADLDH